MIEPTQEEKLVTDIRALADRFSGGWHDGIQIDASDIMALSQAANLIEALSQSLATAPEDAEYYKWRLKAIIPLFEEARDALPAIPLASAKLRNIDLTLGNRMDAAGTATRQDYDAALAQSSTQEKA